MFQYSNHFFFVLNSKVSQSSSSSSSLTPYTKKHGTYIKLLKKMEQVNENDDDEKKNR